jgi:hypothetical protein
MRKVTREHLLDHLTYTDQRAERLPAVLATQAPRRVHVGDHLTFLFENHLTVWFQIQEMMRVEGIVRESQIAHEIKTYNELLGGPGELGAVLLIEIDDPERRDVLLTQWLNLPRHLFAELPDGRRVRASYDERQVGTTRLSAVQYLKFDTGGVAPVALGSDHPALPVRTPLGAETLAAMAEDLS